MMLRVSARVRQGPCLGVWEWCDMRFDGGPYSQLKRSCVWPCFKNLHTWMLASLLLFSGTFQALLDFDRLTAGCKTIVHFLRE